jgi:hypothetical protein
MPSVAFDSRWQANHFVSSIAQSRNQPYSNPTNCNLRSHDRPAPTRENR